MKAWVVFIAALAALSLSGTAGASQLIDRNAAGVKLAVNAKGEALMTYRAGGRLHRVLAWGAMDARQPSSGRAQVRFQKDYTGGWGKYRNHRYWQSFGSSCRPYDGPALAFLVAACSAPDGSYWALQSWQKPLPDLGLTPWLAVQRARELHLSHWSGPLAQIEAWTDWIYSGRFHHLFGRLSYDGKPVYGFGTTRTGATTDSYGRLIFLDTFNSRYGAGWKRENSFVAHNPTGMFCYGFYAFNPTKGYPHPKGFPSTPRGPGTGSQYRLTVIGPGASPDISLTIAGLHDYDRNNAADIAFERQQNATLDSIVGADKSCRQH